jgi:hypothetical protein
MQERQQMRRILGALILGVTAVGCGSSSPAGSSATSPTTPAISDSFSGTVDAGGKDLHQFSVTLSGGQVNVILMSAGPPSTIYMGVGVGTWADSACTLLTNGSIVTQAGSTAQLSGTLDAGSYCVMVYDAGNQVATVNYAVTVNHY